MGEGKPMIQAYSFGRMVVQGRAYSEDLKILQGQVKPYWRRRSGHRMDVEDLQDVIEARPRVLVLGTGSSGMVRVSEDLLQVLRSAGIEVVVEPTAEAVRTFNALLRDGEEVAGAFHLTC